MTKANEGTARLNLAYTRVVAPIAGRVGLRVVDVGNVVSSSDANGIALITQMTPIDVEFSIPQDQAPFAAAERRRLHGGEGLRPHPHHRAGHRRFRIAGQPDRHADRHRARQGPLQQRPPDACSPASSSTCSSTCAPIKDAVVVPVAALRHSSTGDYRLRAQGRPHGRACARSRAARRLSTRSRSRAACRWASSVITEGADRLRDGVAGRVAGRCPRSRRPAREGGGRRRDAASAPAAPAAEGASAPGRPAAPEAAAPAPASRPAAAASAPANRTAVAGAAPTEQQKQRFLDQVKDDPEALQRRKTFLEQIGRGDPAALERWQRIMERRSEGARAAAQ